MRKIESHIVTEADKAVIIEVADDADANGVNHKYDVFFGKDKMAHPVAKIPFISPTIEKGLTEEALLAIVLDRFSKKKNQAAAGVVAKLLHDLQKPRSPKVSVPKKKATKK